MRSTHFIWLIAVLATLAPFNFSRFTSFTVQEAANSSHTQIPGVFVDDRRPYFKPLANELLIGKFPAQEAHLMDAVVMASEPDPTLAACLHNLYHLQGFRRFILVINNATRHCDSIFDLVPQHSDGGKRHMCLEHNSFYSPSQLDLLLNTSGEFSEIHVGAPQLLLRGDKYIKVPRMGWYLQQFSKILIHTLVPDLSEQFLVIDGDIIPTRPMEYMSTDANNKTSFVLPRTRKSPGNWKKFTKDILPDIEKLAESNLNYVVGWMVFDRTVLHDMIAHIDTSLQETSSFKFPFNILEIANQHIKENSFFSEFYVYATFALNQSKVLYKPTYYTEPSRNVGLIKSCFLSTTAYTQEQNNMGRPPWLIWEEHKYHRYETCPDGESAFKLSTVGLWHDFHPPPWGGGNQFMLALRNGLSNLGVDVIGKNDPSDGAQRIRNTAQVLVANAITFKGGVGILRELKTNKKLAFVHRVDGPYYVARYMRPLDATPPFNVPTEDVQTRKINEEFSCATVFQSQWSIEANIQIGISLRNPVVIPNMVDRTIFYPSEGKIMVPGSKVRIVATSHSASLRKGFETMLWVDQNLDFNRYEFLYKGGFPEMFTPENIEIVTAEGSDAVADFLRSGDVYFAPSLFEPASNAVSEALACGLPVLYQEGSSHGELVGRAGIGFLKPGPGLLDALDAIVENYEDHKTAIYVPSMEDIAKRYLSVMRWCFFMKHMMFM